ncbi:MAG: PAAR domain-containing protein [Burkholderiales bacterium]|nr:PAAR domain-containing protein [Burkholderiales bacterium]
MAARPFIVLGDQTDHGGVVIEASQMTDTHGKGIARVGDQVTCPKRDHGTTVIVTGDPTMIIDGKAAARHGDKCACGATLISSQFVSTVGDGGGAASSPQAASQAQAERARASGLISSLLPENHQFDIHFAVRDEKTGDVLPKVSYKITLDDGTSITGVTDENGLTDKISSKTKQQAKLEVHHYGDNSDSGADANNRYDACCC